MIMRGKWEKALARIVESPDAPAGATEPTFYPGHGREYHDYLVEVGSPNGQMVRARVGLTSTFVHAVGEPMAVEVNFKTGEVRLDLPRMSELMLQQANSRRTAAWLERQAPAGGIAQSGAVGPLLGAFDPVPPSPARGGADADDRGTAAERLARLRQLHDNALLTEAEYQARREQIISEI